MRHPKLQDLLAAIAERTPRLGYPWPSEHAARRLAEAGKQDLKQSAFERLLPHQRHFQHAFEYSGEQDWVRLDAIEDVVVEVLRRTEHKWPVATAVVGGESPLSWFGRLNEARRYPEWDMSVAMRDCEVRSLFLYTADLDAGRLAHVMRIVEPLNGPSDDNGVLTGIEVLDDRTLAAEVSEQATLSEVLAFHGIKDLSTCWSIGTNAATGRAQATRNRPYGLVACKALFTLGASLGIEHYFSYLNRATVRSFSRLGLGWDLLFDREFHLPLPGGYDPDYVAAHLKVDEQVLRTLREADPSSPLSRMLAAFEPPDIVVLREDERVETRADGVAATIVAIGPPVFDFSDPPVTEVNPTTSFRHS